MFASNFMAPQIKCTKVDTPCPKGNVRVRMESENGKKVGKMPTLHPLLSEKFTPFVERNENRKRAKRQKECDGRKNSIGKSVHRKLPILMLRALPRLLCFPFCGKLHSIGYKKHKLCVHTSDSLRRQRIFRNKHLHGRINMLSHISGEKKNQILFACISTLMRT